jgi:hypothetical protein
MATASDLAAENIEKMNKAMTDGNKYANDRINVYKKQLDSGKIDLQLYKDKIQAEIDLARESRKTAKDRAKNLVAEIENTSFWNINRRRSLQNQLTLEQEIARREEATIVELKKAQEELGTEERNIEKENKKRALEAIKQRKIEKETSEIDRQKQALQDLADFEREYEESQKTKEEARLARQIELGESLNEINKNILQSSLTEQEKEIQAVREKYGHLIDLAEEFGYGMEEIQDQMNNEMNEINTKYAQEELQSEEEKQAKLLEKEKQALDERRNMRKEFVDGVIDEMNRISQEEEKLIDDRIKAEQDLQSNLQAQASAGNISAQQSIVASMEAEKRATLEKQKEQRKQQALDDIKTLYNLINSNISSGDGVGIATTKAIASMGVIKSVAKVFSALTGFAKGTEWRLGDEHKPMFGGVDGHVVRVDSSEAIVKGSLMDKAERAGITSTSELVQLAVSQKLQPNMYAMNDDRLNYVPFAVKQNNDLSELKRELRDIKDTIKNKTEFSIDPYVLNGMVKGIVETQKTGNFSRKNIFK